MSNTFNNDTEAQLNKIKTGLATFAEIIGEEGKDLQAHVEALAAERDLLAKHGLQHPFDTRAVMAQKRRSAEDAETHIDSLATELELLAEFVVERGIFEEFIAEREGRLANLRAKRALLNQFLATRDRIVANRPPRVSFATALMARSPSDSEG